MGDLKSLEHHRRAARRERRADGRQRDRWYHELWRRPTTSAWPRASTPSTRCTSSTRRGSTAKPKGILHTTGGYLTGVAYTHKVVFDLKPEEDVFWCSADVGWVTGHSYIVYGPLANGTTSVMYEGPPDYPDKDAWWESARASASRSSTPRRPRSGRA